jgi:predicted ATPase/DNA-binding winged helix-turn-helix (wHTH) protein
MHSFGEFRLDAANQCLWRGDQRLSLAPRPFAVLRYLVEHPQRLVTHDEMLDALWPETYVLPQVLRTYILELRKLLEDDPACPRFIETVPKRGYRFLAPAADGARTSPHHHAIVGRAPELALLCDRFAAAQDSRRPTLFLTGEPGIGKTALLDEFCDCICHKNAAVRVARGQSIEGFAGKEKFYPVREALSGLSAGDEKARSLLASTAPAWFAPGPAPDPSVGEICEALESLSQSNPLLLVFEDIHWADDSTIDLIAALARRRAHAKLMLLVSFRSDDLEARHPLRLLQQGLATGRRSEELHLGPLDREAVAEYLRRELRAANIPAALTSLVHQHSSGNPLYMSAIVAYLLSQRIVSSHLGEVSVSQPIESIEIGVPPGLATVIRLRLDRLNEDDRRLLEAGSISGTIFPAWACAAALRRKLADVEEAYASLARRVRLLAIAGDDELPDGTRSRFYVFAHDLYRKAIYGEIPVSRRSQWHMLVADRLREMFAGNEASVAHEIAAHARASKAGPA